ncbi:MAG: hypothetical protein ACKOA5_03575 [Actinomycetota bacterium]
MSATGCDVNAIWGDVDGGARHVEDGELVDFREAFDEFGLVREDGDLVARHLVEMEQVGVEKAGRAGAGHDNACVETFGVRNGAGELRFHF